MTYLTKIPVDPKASPTPSGSVTNYGELSVAPWFGLPICDPLSFPQGACTPDSDSNNPNARAARRSWNCSCTRRATRRSSTA